MAEIETARAAVVAADAARYAAGLAYTAGAYGTALSPVDPAVVASLAADVVATSLAAAQAQAAWHAALDAA